MSRKKPNPVDVCAEYREPSNRLNSDARYKDSCLSLICESELSDFGISSGPEMFIKVCHEYPSVPRWTNGGPSLTTGSRDRPFADVKARIHNVTPAGQLHQLLSRQL